MERVNLKALTREEMRAFFQENGHPAYRGDQLYRWLFRRGQQALSEMSNLGREIRHWLTRAAVLPKLPRRVLADPDGTQKILLTLEDQTTCECVLIPDRSRLTLCLSTQLGCPLACRFCQTGAMGFRRNLEAWEILEQVFAAREVAAPAPLTNLVFMGMGEPLLNFAQTQRAVRQLLDPEGFGFSRRRITVSTSGVRGQVARVEEEMGVLLAVSLNAPEQSLRAKLMPQAAKWDLGELLAEIRRTRRPARQRVTFEYVLFSGMNDAPEQARELARLLSGIPCKLNLILWNRLPGFPFRRPEEKKAEAFAAILRQKGLPVTLRQSRGQSIGAACGQLGGSGEGAVRTEEEGR